VKISARDKKVLIAGVVVAGLVFIFYVGTSVVPVGDGLSNEVQFKRRTLLGQKEMVIREDRYKARINEYRQRLKQDLSRCLPGENASLAGAELQKVLKDLADQNGVEIIRRDVQQVQKLENDLVKVSVRIETQCALDQLVRFLTAIENYGKFLNVDELMVTAFRMQKRFEIRPGLTVSGYIVVPESKPDLKTATAQSTGMR
jgi:type II secretory pathway component PulM